MPRRYQTIHLDQTTNKITPEGYLRDTNVVISRTGVFAYTRADGTVLRELRPADEVADSAASFAGVPVTYLHPQTVVDATNAREVTVGAVGDTVSLTDDGLLVASTLTVFDADAVTAATTNQARELSCGYTVDLDYTPGVHNGEHYDAVQRNIRGNHVSLVPRGRAGAVAALKLDATDAISTTNHTTEPPTMATIKLDGVDIEVPDTAAPLIQSKIDTLTATVDALNERIDATDVDALVRERVAVMDAARILHPDADLEGSIRDVMVSALTGANPQFDAKDRSDDYIQARFDLALEAAADKRDRDSSDRMRRKGRTSAPSIRARQLEKYTQPAKGAKQ